MSLSQALVGPISPVLPSLEIQAAAITAAQLTPRELIFLFFFLNLTPSSPFLWHRHTTAITVAPHPSTPGPSPESPKLLSPRPQVDGAPPAHPLGLILSGPQYLLLQLLSQVESPNSLYGATLSGPQSYRRPGTGSGEESGLEPGPQLTSLPLGIPSPAPKGRGFRVQQGEAEPSGWGWAGRAPWQHAPAARPVTLHARSGKVRALSPRHAPFAPASGACQPAAGCRCLETSQCRQLRNASSVPLVLATPPPALPSQPRPENGWHASRSPKNRARP